MSREPLLTRTAIFGHCARFAQLVPPFSPCFLSKRVVLFAVSLRPGSKETSDTAIRFESNTDASCLPVRILFPLRIP